MLVSQREISIPFSHLQAALGLPQLSLHQLLLANQSPGSHPAASIHPCPLRPVYTQPRAGEDALPRKDDLFVNRFRLVQHPVLAL